MKRRSYRFYSKGWTGSKWIRYDAGSDIFPRLPCCYVLYLDGVMSYVGQTSDLAVRLSAHGVRIGYGNSIITKWGSFKSVVVKARFGDKFGDWAMRELRLIERLQPALNIVGRRAA